MIHLLLKSRALLSAFVVMLLLAVSPAMAQITDLNAAINKAGRERMLSQRMAKAYFQLGQGIDVDRSQRVLDSSIALFDRQLVELKNFAPEAHTRQTSQQLEQAWIGYKDVLVGRLPSQELALEVLRRSDQVLALAHQLTAQFEALAATPVGHLVNIAGRQRMLSQRMAKLYQAIHWKLGDETMAAELSKARKEFAAADVELNEAAVNNEAIKRDLRLVGQQWFFFQDALDQKGLDADKRAHNIATTSERILEMMEEVVAGYEALR